MRDNLRLYHKILSSMQEFLPEERITRLRNFALLVSGLFLAESVHLAKVARQWPVSARLVSLTHRLRRFLKNPRVEVPSLYRPVARCLLASFEPWQEVRLVLDTTKVGFEHRVLTVSLAYRRRTLPLCWSAHRGRKRHLPTDAHLALLRRVKTLIPATSAVSVVGDSEFGRVKIMRWLEQAGWHYVLRVGGHNKVIPEQNKQVNRWVKIHLLPLKEGQPRAVGAVRFTEKHDHEGSYLLLRWAKDFDEPWYLVSDEPVGAQTLRRYKRRMWVEQMYGDFKGHGVDLEATHLTHAGRIERLMLGVCWMYVWLIALGSYVVKRGWRALVDRKKRRDKSYFRIGFDFMGRCMSQGDLIRLRFTLYF